MSWCHLETNPMKLKRKVIIIDGRVIPHPQAKCTRVVISTSLKVLQKYRNGLINREQS